MSKVKVTSFVVSGDDGDRELVSPVVGRPLSERPFAISFDDTSRAARQSFKGQCDVHEILRVFNVTGQMPSKVQPVYMDCRVPTDPQFIADGSLRLTAFYDSLSSSIRTRFPSIASLADFLRDPRNRDEAVRIGLLTVVSPPPAGGVPAVPPAAPGSAAPAASVAPAASSPPPPHS